jgi:hypothetical protein
MPNLTWRDAAGSCAPMQRRTIRAAGALLMVALLSVLIAARAHTHRDLRSTRSCATCVATEHLPVAAVAPVATVPASVAAVTLAGIASIVPARLARSLRTGRAPPSVAPVPVG